MADRKSIRVTTFAGVSIYPKLNDPDTKFDADGVYEVKLAGDADDSAVQAFITKAETLRDEFFQETYDDLVADKKAARAKELKKAEVVKTEVDEETGDETGRVLLRAKMKASGVVKKEGPRKGQRWTQKPDYFDAKGNQLKNPPRIGGGSVLKLSVELEPYLRETDKMIGVSVKLKAVQIIKLVSGGQRSFADHGFGAEDGDEIEDQPTSGFSDETAGGSASSDDDDI